MVEAVIMKAIINMAATLRLSVIATVARRLHIKADSNVVSIYNYLQGKFPHIRHEGTFLYYDIY
jgi:hypothetical protein